MIDLIGRSGQNLSRVTKMDNFNGDKEVYAKQESQLCGFAGDALGPAGNPD